MGCSSFESYFCVGDGHSGEAAVFLMHEVGRSYRPCKASYLNGLGTKREQRTNDERYSVVDFQFYVGKIHVAKWWVFVT